MILAAVSDYGWFTTLLLGADLVVRIGLALRVVMKRRPVGVSLAWLMVILLLPIFGVAVYLLVGESRLGRRRAERARAVHGPDRDWFKLLSVPADVDWPSTCPSFEGLERMTENVVGLPALPGNALDLFPDTQEAMQRIIDDIASAKRVVHVEFYIWWMGGITERVVEALCEAGRRGVRVRVALDAVGSWRALRFGDLRERFEAAGVELAVSLPVSFVRLLLWRLDLRNHRKVVAIDGRVAWAGSLNMIDPKRFKKQTGLGAWVDAMVRIEGPSAVQLYAAVLEDWELTDGKPVSLEEELEACCDVSRPGEAAVQPVPSGPGTRGEGLAEILLTAFYTARSELIITTPYFVPDEPMLMALKSAAAKGVKVTVIVPDKIDSKLARFACEAYLADLLRAGVQVTRFKGGLLHTKSITIDGEATLIGTVNLDQRSLYLNFEVSLFIYDQAFTRKVWGLQRHYINHSTPMTLDGWERRPYLPRLLENTARLLGPLL